MFRRAGCKAKGHGAADHQEDSGRSSSGHGPKTSRIRFKDAFERGAARRPRMASLTFANQFSHCYELNSYVWILSIIDARYSSVQVSTLIKPRILDIIKFAAIKKEVSSNSQHFPVQPINSVQFKRHNSQCR